MAPDPHFLRRLRFPARYEGLVNLVGPDVVRLLVEPSSATLDDFATIGISIPNRGEGLLIPIVAESGTGKTTLARNLSSFLGEYFGPTALHEGPVTVGALETSVNDVSSTLPVNDERVIPLLIDDRESNPATDTEIANMKQFLRRSGSGSRAAVIWPETSGAIATDMANRYTAIVGAPPIDLPITVLGPERAAWAHIAKDTMRLVNGLGGLEGLGVDPDNYSPDEFGSLGTYLRRISDDFTAMTTELLRATQLPISLTVLFASHSSDAGVLSQLTSGTEFGLLDPHALVDASPDSVIGRWWSSRRGLLTQIVVRLDARAFCLPPSVSVPILRRYGDRVHRTPLEDLVDLRSVADLVRTFERGDVGRYLSGEIHAAYESRGTPAVTSVAAYDLLVESVGFGGGRDKLANRALAAFFSEERVMNANRWSAVTAEEALPFASILPDIRVDREGSYVCVELTWRKGEFLGSSSRSTVAQYLLSKLQTYGQELGWVPR